MIQLGVAAAERQRGELPGDRVADEHPVRGRGDRDEAIAVRSETRRVMPPGHAVSKTSSVSAPAVRGGDSSSSQQEAVEGDLAPWTWRSRREGRPRAGDGEKRRGPRAGQLEVAADEGGAGNPGAPGAADASAGGEGLGGCCGWNRHCLP
jgi:hypothetical protein